MKIEQLSIFLENKAGRLAEVTDVLAKAAVNIHALSLADTSDFGILRLIVGDYETAKTALKAAGFTVGLTGVVAVAVPHVPGGLNAIVQMLGKQGVNVEYMYAFPRRGEDAVLIFRFNNPDAAMDVLKEAGVPMMSGEQVCGG
jgi:hypothetical protein